MNNYVRQKKPAIRQNKFVRVIILYSIAVQTTQIQTKTHENMEQKMTLNQINQAITLMYEKAKTHFDRMEGIEDGTRFRMVLRNQQLIVCNIDGGRHDNHDDPIWLSNTMGLMAQIASAIAWLKEDNTLIEKGFSLSYSSRFDQVFYEGIKEVAYEPTEIYVDVDNVYIYNK